MTEGFLEREADLAATDQLVERASDGDGSGLLIEGPAGVGKTELLAAARRRAEEGGMEVLAARGSELERGFAFGVVRQLFERPLAAVPERDRRTLMEGAAGLALPVLGVKAGPGMRLDPPGFGSDPMFSALHGLYWLAVNFSARRPLLLAVDDAHWSDGPSLRFLAYLARRLEGMPVLLAVAAREAEPGAETELLATIAAHEGTSVLRPSLLTGAAVGRLLFTSFATEPDEEFVRACHVATRGNPFLVNVLVRALQADHVMPTADEAVRVQDMGSTAVVRGALLRHIRLIPKQDRAAGANLARAVAVLGPDAELRHAAALADLPQSEAAVAADALAAAGILRPGRPLDFAHPLVRAAVHADLPPAERALAHAAAARLLTADGVPAERVASHILASEPTGDPGAVEVLRVAARRSFEGGAPEAAVSLLRRALEEPPPPDVRGNVLLELGRAEMDSYDPAASDHLTEALAAPDDPVWQVKVSRLLGHTLLIAAQVEKAFEVLDRAVALAAPTDPEAALELEAELLAGGQILYALSAEFVNQRLERHPEMAGRTPAESKLLAVRAFEAGRTNARAAAGLAERALASGHLLADRPADSASFYSLAFALIYGDRLDLCDRCFDEALDDARRRGAVFGFVAVSCLRSYVANLRGAIPDAEAEARNALEADTPHGNPLLPRATACLIDALIERGELSEAATALATAGFESGEGDPVYHGTLAYSRGRLRVAQGRPREGIEDFLWYGGRGGSDLGYRGTGTVIPWRSETALAWLALGEPEEAGRLALEEVEVYRDSGVARGLGTALRALGLIEGGDRGIELLKEAVAVLEESYARVEHARALTDLGAALRRANQRSKAREALQRALDLAHRCGATAFVQRARDELAATGARPRRVMLSGVESLTASERRVAQMAAEGLSNKDIAQALFVTVKTVETHLGHVYQKLDIPSRSELPRVLAETAAEVPA